MAFANPLEVDPSLRVELSVVGQCRNYFASANQTQTLAFSRCCHLTAQITGNPGARIPASIITLARTRNGRSKIVSAKQADSQGQATFRARIRAGTLNDFSANFYSIQQ